MIISRTDKRQISINVKHFSIILNGGKYYYTVGCKVLLLTTNYLFQIISVSSVKTVVRKWGLY